MSEDLRECVSEASHELGLLIFERNSLVWELENDEGADSAAIGARLGEIGALMHERIAEVVDVMDAPQQLMMRALGASEQELAERRDGARMLAMNRVLEQLS